MEDVLLNREVNNKLTFKVTFYEGKYKCLKFYLYFL